MSHAWTRFVCSSTPRHCFVTQSTWGGVIGGSIAMVLCAAGAMPGVADIAAAEQQLSSGQGTARLAYNFARTIAVDGHGGIHVVWSAQDQAGRRVSYVRSLNGGTIWEPETTLTANAIATSEDPLLPTVAASGKDVFVAWHEVRDGKPAVVFRRSADQGATWLAAQDVSHSPSSAAHASLAASGQTVHVVWGDHRDGQQAEIYYRRSLDVGATWQPEVRLSDVPHESWVPAVASSGRDVYVGWVDTKDGNEEEYIRASHDGGVTWGPSVRLTDHRANSWASSIAVSGQTVHVAWFDQRDALMHPLDAELILDEALRMVGVPVESAPTGVMVPHPEGAIKQRAERKLRLIQAATSEWVQRGGDGVKLHAIMHEFERMTHPEISEALQQLDRALAMLALAPEPALPASLPLDDLEMVRGYLERRVTRIQAAVPAWVKQGGNQQHLEAMMREVERLVRGASYADKERKLDEAMQLLGLALDDAPPAEAIQSAYYLDVLGQRVQMKMTRLQAAVPAWVQQGGDLGRLQAILQRFEPAMQNAMSEWDIYYRRSVDGGTTWEPEVRLTSASGSSQRPSIVARGDQLYVAWFDGRDGNTEIYGKSSSDGGRTWSQDARLTQAPGESLYVSVTATPDAVHLVWCDTREGPRAIYYQRLAWSAVPVHARQRGGFIAVADVDEQSRYQIFTVGTDGTNRRQLTSDDGHYWMPAWSPDGRRMAYVSRGSDGMKVLVMDADGGGPQLLADGGINMAPAWSPDGQQIAYAHDPQMSDGIRLKIWVMRADGSRARPLTTGDSDDNVPTWSPDGQRIAFASNRDGGLYRIWVMRADGTYPQPLTQASYDAAIQATIEQKVPAWSPDGSWIAYWSGVEMTQLSVVQANGGQPPTTPPPPEAFTERDRKIMASWSIWVMHPDGSGKRRVTEGDDPAWSPDGHTIIFPAPAPDGHPAIGAVAVDGSNRRVLCLTRGGPNRFAWQPHVDGS